MLAKCLRELSSLFISGPVRQREFLKYSDFELKRNVDVSLYFHSPGFEIWLLYWAFPYPVSTERLAVKSSEEIAGADIHLSKSILSRQDDLTCQKYSVLEWSHCLKTFLKEQFTNQLNCTVPYFHYLGNTGLEECKDKDAFWQSFTHGMAIIEKEQKDGHCPNPCEDPTYHTYPTYVPKRTGLYHNENEVFELTSFYDNLIVVKQVEFYVYSGERLLSAIGGVMGICLGYSILSILLGLIDFIDLKFRQSSL